MRRILFLSVLLVTAVGVGWAFPPAAGGQTLILDAAVDPFTNNIYLVLDEAGWVDAQDAAVLLGGNLVTINDAAENQWLVDNLGA